MIRGIRAGHSGQGEPQPGGFFLDLDGQLFVIHGQGIQPGWKPLMISRSASPLLLLIIQISGGSERAAWL